MKVRAQIGMVLNLDKCIGCHTCSVTCKNVWTSRDGVEYAWFNNVETKPGIGYPKDWENQKRWNGGWERTKSGKIQPKQGAKWRILANIFANPDLPEIDDYAPTTSGDADSDPEPPLARATDWVNVEDPDTGEAMLRETNTMPQWAGSCWYYLRFLDAQNSELAWGPEKEKYWMPVDLYVGGAEHAVLHLLYARFWHKVLFDLGLVSTAEPFQKLRHQVDPSVERTLEMTDLNPHRKV